jgi:hypothetical protein
MTQDDIDKGKVICLVGVAPLRPAEFILLKIVQEPEGQGSFLRGDSNADGSVDLSDPVGVLGYIFLGQEAPPCLDAADAGDEGTLTISSAVYVLNFLFLGSRAMPAPFPECGLDPTPDDLGDCEAGGSACP